MNETFYVNASADCTQIIERKKKKKNTPNITFDSLNTVWIMEQRENYFNIDKNFM